MSCWNEKSFKANNSIPDWAENYFVKMDVDRFATYELDELFDEQDHIIMNSI